MNRRRFLAGCAAGALLLGSVQVRAAAPVKRRVRPSDPEWPSA